VTPELANYEGSGIKHTSEVGMYPANAFGLYDMHGNVWEWCEDTWHENYVDAPNDGTAWDGDNPFIRLLRGGSWYNTVQKLHSATRIGFDTTSRYDNEGFRVMRLVEIS
jgi:formylglycine-generating enzyme required for sulfatase activity